MVFFLDFAPFEFLEQTLTSYDWTESPTWPGLVTFLLFITVFYYVYTSILQIFRPSRVEELSRPERQSEYPLFGNVMLKKDLKEFIDPNKELYYSKALGTNYVVVNSAELATKLFRTETQTVRGEFQLLAKDSMSSPDSVLFASGQKHKMLRRLLLPCFRPSVLKVAGKQVEPIVKRYFDKWSTTEVFDAKQGLRDLALENGISFIGFDTESMSDDHRRYISDLVTDIITAFFCIPINLGKYSTLGRGMIAKEKLEELVRDTIKSRQHATAEAQQMNGESIDEKDVLQHLIEMRDDNGDHLTESVMVDNMAVFVAASFDTVTGGLHSIMINMCQNPEIQEKAHEHIRSVLGPESDVFHGRERLSIEKLQELPYIEQVMKESLRLIPIVCFTSTRTAIKDFELGGKQIKKDDVVFVDEYSRCHSSKYWTNPLKFDPDRFGPDRAEDKRHKMQYAPFGAGIRQCIGGGFAKLELKIITTLLLRDYKVSFAKRDFVPKTMYSMFLKIDGELPVRFERRQKL